MHHVLKSTGEAQLEEQMEAARAQQGRLAVRTGEVRASCAVRSSDRGGDHNRRNG